MKNVQIRIGNLKFGEATYVGEKPEFPVYFIDVVEKNRDYEDFKKGYFVEDEKEPGMYHYNGPDEKRKWIGLYDKSCFQNEECAWAVAECRYNEQDNVYEMNFFRWRELLDPKYVEHRKDFWRMLAAINESGIFDYPIKCEELV